jgi:hypothetical protein
VFEILPDAPKPNDGPTVTDTMLPLTLTDTPKPPNTSSEAEYVTAGPLSSATLFAFEIVIPVFRGLTDAPRAPPMAPVLELPTSVPGEPANAEVAR